MISTTNPKRLCLEQLVSFKGGKGGGRNAGEGEDGNDEDDDSDDDIEDDDFGESMRDTTSAHTKNGADEKKKNEEGEEAGCSTWKLSWAKSAFAT